MIPDGEATSSYTSPPSSSEQASKNNFVAKCANHLSLSLLRRRENEAELSYESDEDNNSVPKQSPEQRPGSKRIKKSNSRQMELNNLDKGPSLSKEEREMVRLAGGPNEAFSYARQCEDNLKSGVKKMEPMHGGDTLLMEKCIQKQPLSDKKFWKKNHAEILAYSKIMAQSHPELLIHRNHQNVNALDLASLNDKSSVAVFLARLLESKGYDPNAPNDQGHTVLHLLARKGDDCSSTLEALLAMRKISNASERLFRIDVVNQGHKTPLDVAVICAHKYATGKDRAIYTETINLFREVIFDQAKELTTD